jgi:hypothetical protein
VVYTPAGAEDDVLSIFVNDLGHNGIGGPLSVMQQVAIAVNQAPVINGAAPGGFSFTTIDAPGATFTIVQGNNDAGDLVGQAHDGGSYFGWMLSGGTFTTITVPGANNSSAGDINDAGVVAGSYEPGSSTPRYGYTLEGGVYTQINLSPFISTTADGINDDGAITGAAYQGGSSFSGFLIDSAGVTSIDYPGSGNTRPGGINDSGDIVGFYDNFHGFVYEGGVYTTLDAPNAPNGTFPQGINNADDVVGWYTDASGVGHGFLYREDVFTPFDHPLGARGTLPTDINDAGEITGWYIDAAGVNHGFVAEFNPGGAIPDMSVNAGFGFNLSFPPELFSDPDGDALSYSAVLSNGDPLPGWLSFDPNIRTLSGNPTAADLGITEITFRAMDPSGLFVSDTFALQVLGTSI